MPSIAQYRAFVAVVQCGSVTAAAQRLGRTQPQVSRLVASLERELGFDLFARDNRRLAPTERGARFYEETCRALDGIDHLDTVATQISQEHGETLRVLAPTYVAHSFLAGAVARLLESHPRLKVSIEIVSRNSMGSWVTFHPFDVGIVTLPFEQTGVTVQPFAKVDSLIVLSQRHKLASKRSVVLGDLEDQPCILLTRNTPLRQRLDRIFDEKRFAPRVVVETSSSISACELAAEGIGWTIADSIVCQPLVRKLGLVARKWKPGLRAEFGFIHTGSGGLKPAAAAFIGAARQFVDRSPVISS